MVSDMLHFAARVPSIPVQRRMNLARLLAARGACAAPPPWTAIFVKAHALTARAFPELRRSYIKIPWPHLYEYPGSSAVIACEREYRGEPGLFPLLIKNPESLALNDLGRIIRHASTSPVEEIKSFRRALSICGLPRPLRRLLWWLGLNLGRQRANYLGTFGLSAYSALGVDSLHPLSIWTIMLNYGPIDRAGGVDVRMIYDHRTLDGGTVGRALARLEETLNGVVAEELMGLSKAPTQSGQ